MPIHDRVYERMAEAPRARRGWPGLPIARMMLAYNTRGWAVRGLLLMCLVIAVICGFVVYFTVSAGALTPFRGEAGKLLPAQIWLDYGLSVVDYGMPYILIAMALLTPMLGSASISEDMRRHAIDIYLSRPIRWYDYLGGKLLAIALPLAAVLLLTSIFPLAVLHALEPGFFTHTWQLYLRALLAAVVGSLLLAVVMLGLSSVGRSRRYASVLWYLTTFGTSMLAIAAAATAESGEAALLSFGATVQAAVRATFGVPALSSFLPDGLQERIELPEASTFAIAACVWAAIALFITIRRIRGSERS